MSQESAASPNVVIDNSDEPKQQEVNLGQQFQASVQRVRRELNKQKSLSNVGRVMMAIAEFPLGDNYPAFTNKKEQDLFLAFQDLFLIKQQLMQEVLEYMKEKEAEADAAKENNNDTAPSGKEE